MFKIIIVDDDFLVRTYLKQLKAWEKAGYELVGDAGDGEAALELIENIFPDVIITDISMPLLDGIELIKKVREHNQSSYIIVLSCHDDFEYVKEAMKCGADEYVLKNSLNEESLYKLLQDTSVQLKDRKKSHSESEKKDSLIETGRGTLKYHFFNGILSGSYTAEERERRRKEAGVSAKYINSAVITVFFLEWAKMQQEHSRLELDQISQKFLRDITEEMHAREDSPFIECIYLGEGIFCIFVDLSELRGVVGMKQRLTQTATACFRCTSNVSHEMEVGVSSICFGTDGMPKAFHQARDMMKLSFYKKDTILYYDEEPSIGKVVPREAERMLDVAEEFVDEDDYEGFKQYMESVVKAFEEFYTDRRLVIQWIKKLDQKLKVDRMQESYNRIVRIDQLIDLCEEYHKKIFLEKKSAVPEGINSSVRFVVNYLNAHYKEPIGLNDAADVAGLNAAYLSYLFKQEMGVGFSNYLLNLRMECAAKLLQKTNDKVKDVAEKSGFGDYRYFAKTFKKIYGMSPAEYRKTKK